jgi:hypothetical protein
VTKDNVHFLPNYPNLCFSAEKRDSSKSSLRFTWIEEVFLEIGSKYRLELIKIENLCFWGPLLIHLKGKKPTRGSHQARNRPFLTIRSPETGKVAHQSKEAVRHHHPSVCELEKRSGTARNSALASKNTLPEHIKIIGMHTAYIATIIERLYGEQREGDVMIIYEL